MLVNLIPIVLKIFKSKYTYFVIVAIVIGLMYMKINSLQKTIEQKQNVIEILNRNNTNLSEHIEILKKDIADREQSLSSVNNVLTKCQQTQDKQVKDILEINSIMDEVDEQETTEQPVKEKTNEVSKTTYIKGIDFINSSLSSVK